MWLPETEERPVRPDLPWLRNLSWVKLHAMQIGFAVGVIIYWGLSIGQEGVVFGFALLTLEVALSIRRRESDSSTCNHRLGVHDLRLKPWYGISAAVATWAALTLLLNAL